uniref:MFS domain-containing protein n=1 Tax=Haemonchus contortus TaxID=6289 RepID=A0A7I4YGH7_HAECO
MASCLNINRFHVVCFLLWQCALFYCCQQIFPIFFNFMPQRICEDAEFRFTKDRCQLTPVEQCEELRNCSRVGIVKPPFHSMVEEFDLYCDKAYDATLVATIQFLGVLAGTMIYGHLGDRFGRRPVSFCGILIGITFGVASGFAPSWQVFAMLRFVCGTSVACILVVFYTYIIELIRPEQRVFMRSFFNWGYARIVFTLTCMLCDHWRSAAIATAMLASPTLLAIAFYLPETPKWYASKGRMKEAREAEKRLCYLSGKKSERAAEVSQETSDSKKYTAKHLVQDRHLATRTAILCSLWFATSLSAFGSDLNSGNLLGNFYVNQIASAMMIAFTKIFVFLLDTYWSSFDRRKLHQIPQVLVIVCYSIIMCLQMFVPEKNCDGNNWKDWIIIITNIIGISFIEITWDSCYLVAAECFPTHIRTIGMGTCSLSARIGALIAPQMAYLSIIYQPAPYIVVVCVGLIALGISIAFLPNTKGVDLAHIGKDTKNVTVQKMQAFQNGHNIVDRF